MLIMLSALFKTILYQPIFNAFVALYNIVPGHDVGVVILIITALFRLALYPLTSSSLKAQKSLQDLQPKLEEIKKKYPADKQAQAQATMEVYKNNKVNPLASCLPLLLQLPVIIALYSALRAALSPADFGPLLYSFVKNPGTISPMTLGFLNLALPSAVLAVLAGIAQFFQAKSLSRRTPPRGAGSGAKDEDMMASMNKQMLYVMPVMTVVIGLRLPGGLTLYWFLSTGFMALQQYFLFKKKDSNTPSAPSPSSPVIEGTIVK